jgi:CelD/BcsL family acetyltransferase involved in cellulose biosynthesis
VSGAPLRVETVGDAAGLAALAPGWDALVYDMPRPSPYLLHGWVTAWWRAYGSGAALQVHVAWRDGRLVGALPLCVRRERGLRVLRFVGAGDSALADVLLAGGQDGEVAAALAARAVASRHDYADLFGLPSGSRLAAALGPARLAVVPRVAAPVLDLRPGWEAIYGERISGKHRKAQARARRRLAEQGRLETRVARTREEIDRALDGAFALHALRWRDRPEGSGFATPAGRVLQREALGTLAADGVPWIVTLHLDGRAIAFTAFFLLAGRMVLHHTAFDPAYARWSPGRMATYDALAAASAAGAWRVELLGGAEPYKLVLADGSEPLHAGLGLASGVRGHAAVAVRRAGLVARRELARRPRLRRAWYDGLVPVRRAHRHLTRG